MILRSTTVQAAMQFVTEQTAALAVTPAAPLAEGALQTMLTTKLKLGAMAILLFGCAVTIAGFAIPQATPEKQPNDRAEAPASARPASSEHVRKDRYGDPLPPGAIARLGTVRLRHQGVISAAVFMPDGKTVIVADPAGGIISWDVASRRKIRQYNRTPLSIDEPLALSADDKTLVFCTWGGGVEF